MHHLLHKTNILDFLGVTLLRHEREDSNLANFIINFISYTFSNLLGYNELFCDFIIDLRCYIMETKPQLDVSLAHYY